MIFAVTRYFSHKKVKYDACNFLTNRWASVTEVSVTKYLADKEKDFGGLDDVKHRDVL